MKSLKKVVLSTFLATTLLSGLGGFTVQAENVSEGSITESTTLSNEERANDSAYSEEATTENDGLEFVEEGNITAVTIGGETAEVIQVNLANPEAPVNNTPNRITTNLTEDPSTSMHFQCHKSYSVEEAQL